jgi:hypothetical protein
MGYIPAQNARAVFTTVLANKFEDLIEAPSFLRSFFPDKVYKTKYITSLARRGTEKIAIDVIRGSKGNRNKMDVFTEKGFLPPYFKELIDVTAMNVYDIPFYANGQFNTIQIEAIAEETAIELNEAKKTIDRSIELQAAQALETGIVTVNSGDSIDYKRKAAMIEVLSGGDLWDATDVDILKFFEDKGQLLRSIGKVSGGTDVNVVMGNLAWQAFRSNTDLNNKEKFYESEIKKGSSAQFFNSVGGAYRITLKMGVYNFNIWTYDEVYDFPVTDVSTRYFSSKMVVLIPESFKGETSFAQVPMLPDFIRKNPRSNRVFSRLRNKMKGFSLFDFVNEEDELYTAGIKTAPLAQIVSVDRLYTAQVLA